MLTTENSSTSLTTSETIPEVDTMPVTLDREWVEHSMLTRRKPSSPLILDFVNTTTIDSAGMSLVYYLNRLYTRTGKKLILRNIAAPILDSLKAWQSGDDAVADGAGERASYSGRLENRIKVFNDMVVQALSMLTEMIYWGSIGLLKKRDFRRGVLAEQMFLLGYKSLGIICLLSFLIGVVLALQTAMQLEQYGAGIFLAPMLGISMIRELGPLLTAIIIAGRNGSATTAEIATMVVGEEIDALKTMGINPIQFVVVPKFWAMMLTMPFLSLGATIVGIAGGFCMAVAYLRIASNLFLSELLKNVFLPDVTANIIKSVVFAGLIIWIGAFHGFRVKGGAEEVGRETTASVVTGIFIVIVADAIFSFIL